MEESRRQKGLSKTEYLVVVVILMILGATLITRYLNSKDEAKESVIHNVHEALQVVVASVRFQSTLQETESIYSAKTQVNGVEIQTYYGYPEEVWQNKLEHLLSTNFQYLGNGYQDESLHSKVCEHTVCVVEKIKLNHLSKDSSSSHALAFFPKGKTLQDKCAVFYRVPVHQDSKAADSYIETIKSGC